MSFCILCYLYRLNLMVGLQGECMRGSKELMMVVKVIIGGRVTIKLGNKNVGLMEGRGG